MAATGGPFVLSARARLHPGNGRAVLAGASRHWLRAAAAHEHEDARIGAALPR
jgi:hypothetical protein